MMDVLLDDVDVKDKERASKIFAALEGMKIYEAQLLLEDCTNALTAMEIQFGRSANDV